MAETMKTAAQSLIERAAKVDPVLAADIRAFAQQREFGLVFEHNRPEQMRLYGKPIAVGDTVQILPPRGEKEGASSKVMWSVNAIADDMATLSNGSGDSIEATIEDLVAVAEYDQPIYAGLKETDRIERGGDKPYQVVINGENYHALESLLFCYAGKVDCIYIDPPYNTGARDWKYNNDYVGNDDAYRHSKWLAMMERRLRLAKKLLNPLDSILVIAIDEKEQARLSLLLEQIFAGCTIQMATVVINPKGSVKAGLLTRCDEYLFYVYLGDAKVTGGETDYLYAESKKKKVRWPSLKRTGTNSRRASYKSNAFYPLYYSSETGLFEYAGDSIDSSVPRESVPIPAGMTAVWPIDSNGDERIWQLYPESLRALAKEGYIDFGVLKNGSASPYYVSTGLRGQIESGEINIVGYDERGAVKLEYADGGNKTTAKTTWNMTSHSASEHGTNLIKKFLPNRRFPYPKSLYAVEDALNVVVGDKKEALILDFFSGSGTTAHAVMRLNRRDNGTRRSISITNNEVSEQEAKQLVLKGLRQGDEQWEALGICEYITKPRIKAAIEGVSTDGEPIKGDYGFNDIFPMSEGFEENAVFFELTYEEPDEVSLGAAYSEIAPLLWMRAGCKGEIISTEVPSFAFTANYGILFNYSRAQEFVAKAKENPSITSLFVITDDETRYANIKKALPECDVVRLYESYLRSFKIAAEGALN